MQAMFNSIMEAVGVINANNGLPPPVAAVFATKEAKTAVMGYNEAKGAISAATSSVELESAWRRIELQEWQGWQKKELIRLKELQQTKIDF